MRIILAIINIFFANCVIFASDVAASIGRLRERDNGDSTYAWQLQYFGKLSNKSMWSIGWMNEGHLPNHHRDGATLQIWHFLKPPAKNFEFGAGIGIYRYFDTKFDENSFGYKNKHGALPIFSIIAKHRISSNAVYAYAQFNTTIAGEAPQTQAFLAGLGFRFGASTETNTNTTNVESENQNITSNEFTVFFGKTIINSRKSETCGTLESIAIEYKRYLNQSICLSIAYCDEGEIDKADRDGFATQLWIIKKINRKNIFGFGIGPYLSRTEHQNIHDANDHIINYRTSFRYSMMYARSITNKTRLKVQWNRTLTTYHKDTDVIQLGISYEW